MFSHYGAFLLRGRWQLLLSASPLRSVLHITAVLGL